MTDRDGRKLNDGDRVRLGAMEVEYRHTEGSLTKYGHELIWKPGDITMFTEAQCQAVLKGARKVA